MAIRFVKDHGLVVAPSRGHLANTTAARVQVMSLLALYRYIAGVRDSEIDGLPFSTIAARPRGGLFHAR